ncbi:hypothetical protein GJ496_000066 [Pomphorhynchus laevis]|nr:hypothetical protein GJ496_000066 [Pomphorhynchus laevis]
MLIGGIIVLIIIIVGIGLRKPDSSINPEQQNPQSNTGFTNQSSTTTSATTTPTQQSGIKFEGVEIKTNVHSDVLKNTLKRLICGLIARNPTHTVFYVKIGGYDNISSAYNATLYSKRVDKCEECVKEFNKDLQELLIQRKVFATNDIEIDLSSIPDTGELIVLDEWDKVVTERNECLTDILATYVDLWFNENATVVEAYRDDLQKALCSKIKSTPTDTSEIAPYFINVADFNSINNQFRSAIYYKEINNYVGCMDDKCGIYFDNNLKNQTININGIQLQYTVAKHIFEQGKQHTVYGPLRAKDWIEVESRKKMKCLD